VAHPVAARRGRPEEEIERCHEQTKPIVSRIAERVISELCSWAFWRISASPSPVTEATMNAEAIRTITATKVTKPGPDRPLILPPQNLLSVFAHCRLAPLVERRS